MSVSLPYSVIIRWSDEDQKYIAHLPEFGEGAMTHGDSYEAAASNAREVLEMLVESYMSDGHILPKPDKFILPPLIERSKHRGRMNIVRRNPSKAAVLKD